MVSPSMSHGKMVTASRSSTSREPDWAERRAGADWEAGKLARLKSPSLGSSLSATTSHELAGPAGAAAESSGKPVPKSWVPSVRGPAWSLAAEAARARVAERGEARMRWRFRKNDPT